MLLQLVDHAVQVLYVAAELEKKQTCTRVLQREDFNTLTRRSKKADYLLNEHPVWVINAADKDVHDLAGMKLLGRIELPAGVGPLACESQRNEYN